MSLDEASAAWPDLVFALEALATAHVAGQVTAVMRVRLQTGWQHTDEDVRLRQFLVGHLRSLGWGLLDWRIYNSVPNGSSSPAPVAYGLVERG